MTLDRVLRLIWLAAMCATLAVVCAMCFKSPFNAHPDEKDHVGAGRYYMQYWDPPKVGDERARGAYSNYGVSYLDQVDSVYFFAGKFAAAVKPLAGEDYIALRLFNVALFAGLMALFWRLPPVSRVCFLPLFISPQIWYVFSYFNGDALPLTLSFLSVFLACRLMEAPRRSTLAWLGLVLGLMVVSKLNYYVYIAFFCCFWAGSAWMLKRPDVRLRQVLLPLALAAAVVGLRLGVNALVVGNQPPDAVYKVAEQLAAEDFKPSKQIEGTGYWGMNMRAQGLTFQEMFTKWNWHIWSQRTSFGVYGYMKIYAPLLFYRYITWMLYALLGACLIPVARTGRSGAVLSGMFVCFALMTLGQAFWHSWTADFQAQGRYFFPVLGMLGCLLACFARDIRTWQPGVWAVGVAMWCMSMWSFATVGLAQMVN